MDSVQADGAVPEAVGRVPAPSATVVLARERGAVLEFLLVKRHANTAFGANHAFPGGLVAASDRAVHRRCTGQLAAEAARCLRLAEGALDYYSAAVRELFEETGVLLARDTTGAVVGASAAGEDGGPFPGERRQLLGGKLSWPAFLDRHGLMLAADLLAYFAWWITPVARPARFSTRFFLAGLPRGQAARHDGRELTDSCWITAEGALAACERGEIRLPPPTFITLRDFARITRFDDLAALARRRAAAGVPAILPATMIRNGREEIVLPGEPGYPTNGSEQ